MTTSVQISVPDDLDVNVEVRRHWPGLTESQLVLMLKSGETGSAVVWKEGGPLIITEMDAPPETEDKAPK